MGICVIVMFVHPYSYLWICNCIGGTIVSMREALVVYLYVFRLVWVIDVLIKIYTHVILTLVQVAGTLTIDLGQADSISVGLIPFRFHNSVTASYQ